MLDFNGHTGVRRTRRRDSCPSFHRVVQVEPSTRVVGYHSRDVSPPVPSVHHVDLHVRHTSQTEVNKQDFLQVFQGGGIENMEVNFLMSANPLS